MGSSNVGSPTEEGPEAPDHPDPHEARGPLTSERFPRAGRLTKAVDYRRVLARGRKHRSAPLDIVWMSNDAGHPRLGLVVPKFQSSAVARNRLRRRLKEIWRRGGLQRVGSVDVVFRARRETYQATPAGLARAVSDWITLLNRSAE